MAKQFCTYIITNRRNGTLYVGVTSNLSKRVWEHREKVVAGFSKRYSLNKLVYYELHDDAEHAILREKHMKKLYRKEKLTLIEAFNPRWRDLFEEACS